MKFRLSGKLAVLPMIALIMASCGGSGPVKATKPIQFGEKFYNNWDGSKIGESGDTIVLLSSFAGKDIAAGQQITPADLIDAVNVDIEWLKNTSFSSHKNPGHKLKLLPGAKLRIEKNGKTVAEGDWTIESKDADTNYLSVKFPGKEPMELLGAHRPANDQRFLILNTAGGPPEEMWIEDIELLKKSSAAPRKQHKRHR